MTETGSRLAGKTGVVTGTSKGLGREILLALTAGLSALSLLSVLSPAEAVELLSRRLQNLTADVDETRADVESALEGGRAWVFLVEEEYRLAVLEAECRFVIGLIESLQQPEYVRAWNDVIGGTA